MVERECPSKEDGLGPVRSSPRERGPRENGSRGSWIPAFAGMSGSELIRRAANGAPGAGAEIAGDAPAARSARAAQPAIADRILPATGDGDGGGAACRHGAGNLIAEII